MGPATHGPGYDLIYQGERFAHAPKTRGGVCKASRLHGYSFRVRGNLPGICDIFTIPPIPVHNGRTRPVPEGKRAGVIMNSPHTL